MNEGSPFSKGPDALDHSHIPETGKKIFFQMRLESKIGEENAAVKVMEPAVLRRDLEAR